MAGKVNYTVDDLLDKAAKFLQSIETVPLAEKFYAKALALEPNNTIVMDDYAECLLEIGNIPFAAEKSIDLDPEGGHQKYMIAGQLSSGIESLTCFNKGIELLINKYNTLKEDNTNEHENEMKQISKDISAAYCSMAEIFMTDLCFDDGAEDECTRLIEESLKWCHTSPEAHLLRAQCLLAKSEPNIAMPCVLTSYSLWKDKEENEWPSYAIRVSTAKIFIELRQLEDATELLEKLTHEDDEDSEIWYLLGLCYFNLADENSKDSEYYFDAEECLKKSLNLLKMSDEPMDEPIKKVKELIQSTNEAIKNIKEMDVEQ